MEEKSEDMDNIIVNTEEKKNGKMIPDGWELKKINEVFTIRAGGDLKEKYFSPNKTEKECYPVFANSLIEKGLYGYTSKPFFPKDSLTITGRGDLGHVEYRDTEYDAIVRLNVLIPKKESDVYVKFFEPLISQTVKFVNESTGVPQLTAPAIRIQKIIYPKDKKEQIAISGIISKVDQCIENVQKSIDAIQRLKKALMQNLLTGRMKPDGTMRKDDEFYEHPKMGKVPLGWEVKKLKDIAINRGDYGSNSSAVPFSKDTPRFIRITDISDEGQLYEDDIVSSTDNTEKYILYDDDFLFARTGDTVGKSLLYKESMGKAIFAGYLIRFVLNKEFIIPEYFDLIAKSEFFEAFKVSMKRVGVKPNINSREYCSFRFILPNNKNEQTAILGFFDTIIKKKIKSDEKINCLQRLKKSLMQNLLTGKKRIDVAKINSLLEKMK